MSVSTSWQSIEEQLSVLFPDVLATLQGPVSSADLAELHAFYGDDIPDAYLESLQRHDGQRTDAVTLAICNGYKLLSVIESIQLSRKMAWLFDGDDNRVHPMNDGSQTVDTSLIWNPRWLPFAECNSDTLIIDLAPRSKGHFGQIFNRGHDAGPGEPFCGSFADWLARLEEAFTRREGFHPQINKPPHTIWFQRTDLWLAE